MRAELINPFVESVHNLFTMMLGCEAQRGDVSLTRKELPVGQEIVCIIGLSGSARGTVAISLPVATALKMTTRMMGMEVSAVDETVLDAVSEMVNIVAGGAKAKLKGETGAPLNLSLPTVIRGSNYQVAHPSWAVWLDIPFESELGPFVLCVTFESDNIHHRQD